MEDLLGVHITVRISSGTNVYYKKESKLFWDLPLYKMRLWITGDIFCRDLEGIDMDNIEMSLFNNLKKLEFL